FRLTVNSNSVLPSKMGKYCFGFDFRESGHRREPTPPDNMTFIMVLIPILIVLILSPDRFLDTVLQSHAHRRAHHDVSTPRPLLGSRCSAWYAQNPANGIFYSCNPTSQRAPIPHKAVYNTSWSL